MERIDGNTMRQLLLSNEYPKMAVAYKNKRLFLACTGILAKKG